VKSSYSNITRGQIPETLTDTTIANTSAQGQENNSIESGTGDGSNPLATQTDSPGAITGLSNLKRKMAAIDLEREAFKVDQASLKEKVSTITSSLENMADDIIAVRQDMTHMSARFRSDIAELTQLLLNMSVNKRGRKQSKVTAGSSSSSSEKRAYKSMDTYEDIAHDMETSWTNMCESEDDTSDQNNVSQGYSKPIQGKAGNN
jgi:ParB-like chromosome segregation protein Spo0J